MRVQIDGTGDHPRVCGEKAAEYIEKLEKQGSPPRVRGKVPATPDAADFWRITPACAGKSFSSSNSARVI